MSKPEDYTAFKNVTKDFLRQQAEQPTEQEIQELDQQGRGRGDPVPAMVGDDEVARQDPAILEAGYAEPEDPDSPADPDALPEWAREAWPANLRVPNGRTVVVMRFRREWTDDKRQDRTCVMWNLSVGDEKLANQRGGDNAGNTMLELAKQMIRAVDGRKVDYSKGVNDLDRWWDSIGRKCRSLVFSHFVKAHSLTTAEKLDFLAGCVVARTCYAGG